MQTDSNRHADSLRQQFWTLKIRVKSRLRVEKKFTEVEIIVDQEFVRGKTE